MRMRLNDSLPLPEATCTSDAVEHIFRHTNQLSRWSKVGSLPVLAPAPPACFLDCMDASWQWRRISAPITASVE